MANIVLENDKWETSGIYDITEAKTQRQINADFNAALDSEIMARQNADSALQGKIDDLQDIVGDGSLSGFTSTDLTGAANELKGSISDINKATETEAINFDTEKRALVYFDYVNSTGTKPSFTANGYLLNIYRSTSYEAQIAFQRDLSGGVYMRAKSSGAWGAWELAQGYDGRFDKFSADANTAYDTVADLVTLATSHETNDIFIHRLASSLLSDMVGSTTTLGGLCLLMKASGNNAYYLAWNRNVIGIGNLNLQGNGLTNIKTILVQENIYTDLTLSNVATNVTAYAKAYGKTVNVVGNYSNDVSRTADWTPLCTLPSGYRPSTTIYFVGCNNVAGDMPYMYRINTSGIVAMYTSSGTNTVKPRFCVTFIV